MPILLAGLGCFSLRILIQFVRMVRSGRQIGARSYIFVSDAYVQARPAPYSSQQTVISCE